MTAATESNPVAEVVQMVVENGLEGLPQAVSILLNEAMKIERSRALAAAPYERSPERLGYANGFKPRTLSTRLGKLDLRIPQVRGEGVEFYPSALERGQRSEKALTVAMAEMYVQGVSTRKVSAMVEELSGFEVTATQVSRAAAALDEELTKWRQRPLGEVPYLLLDARYEKVRVDGVVRSCAVLIAIGVLADGHRSVLSCSVSLSEAEVHWRTFLHSLKERGLHGLQMITSDDHEGLRAARRAVFPGAPWQRCQAHLQRNAAAYVPKREMRAEVAADLRDVFDAPSREEAERLLDLAAEKYRTKAAKLAAWMAENVPEGLTVLSGANTGTWYYTQDRRNSVTTITDAAGAMANAYDYTAMDETLGSTRETVSQRYQYTGRELNPLSGEHYFRYRTYSPSTGMFFNGDPLGYVDGTSQYQGLFALGHLWEDPYGLAGPSGGATYEEMSGSFWVKIGRLLERAEQTMARSTAKQLKVAYETAPAEFRREPEDIGQDLRRAGHAPRRRRDDDGTPAGKECPNVCGPEVGFVLDATLRNVVTKFNSLPAAKKEKVCSPNHLSKTWDIQFKRIMPSNCGTRPACQDCVSVNGVNSDYWKVNYILFGTISRLCGFSGSKMHSLILAHKGIATVLPNSQIFRPPERHRILINARRQVLGFGHV